MSYLANIGFLIEYEELAVALAEDTDRLYAMRQHLEQTRATSAAFDTARWVKNFEQGLYMAYRKHEQNQPHDHIELEDKEPLYQKNDNLF